MAELRRQTPSTITLYTAGALEQGRNGWTHQRPEIEAYFASMMRNGNVFPVFPPEFFARVSPKDTMKRKQFQKGMTQLAQEGAVQIFEQPGALDSFVVAGTLTIGSVTISTGTGAPSGGCTTGSLFLRTDGGSSTTLYVCESSAWSAK